MIRPQLHPERSGEAAKSKGASSTARCNAGTFTLVSGQSARRLVAPTEVVHSSPRADHR